MADSDSSDDAEDYCEVCNEKYSDNVRPRCLVCELAFCTDCLNNSIKDETLVCPYCEQQRRSLSKKGLETELGTVEENGRKALNKLVLFSSDSDESKDGLILTVHVEKLNILNYQSLILYKEAANEVLSQKVSEIMHEIETAANRREAELKILVEADIDFDEVCGPGSDQEHDSSECTKENFKSKLSKQSKSSRSLIDEHAYINKVAILQSMMHAFEASIVDNPIYAVKEIDGRMMSARITIDSREENPGLTQVYLHYFKDEAPPSASRTVQGNDLFNLLGETKVVTAFLDLSWEECIQGRVYINLKFSTSLAKHFVILCTGVFGPTYAGSSLLQVMDKGDPIYESVIGGDYELNNGLGGRPLFSGLDMTKSVYAHKGAPGIVWAAFQVKDGPKSAQFGITIGSAYDPERCKLLGEDVKRYEAVFGKVKRGLDVVKKAAKQFDIRSVKISDCGVVLPIVSWSLRKMIVKQSES